MATPQDQPWSNDEKNYLLAEIIKAQSPPHNVLLNVVISMNITVPRWNELFLPHQRNLKQCQAIFDEMRRRPLPLPPNPMFAGAGPKRSLADPQQYGGGRAIQPKPPTSSSSQFGQPPSGEPPVKRKRGRPPKAATQAREAEAAARMAQQAPIASAAVRVPPISPRPPSTGAASTEERPTAPLTRGMDLQSMLRTPPRQSTTASQSSSSSGKRRRMRTVYEEQTRPSSASGEYFHEPRPSSRPLSSVDDPSLPRPMYHYYATESGSPTRSSPRAAQPSVQTQPSAAQPPLNPS